MKVVGEGFKTVSTYIGDTLDYPSEYTLLDCAASVHVVHNKDRFTSLRRPDSKEALRCGNGTVPITGWGEVSIPLQGSKLVLKNVALIPDFPLNLVSLGTLQKLGFQWTHWSGELRGPNGRLTGTTTYHKDRNTYEINHSLNSSEPASAFATTTTKKSPNSRRQPLATLADADIWHQRMGHIGPLGLYKLGQGCLGVRLRGKTMTQCSHCAISKISQQVSQVPPANQVTRPFYRVSIDWLDLEKGWDSYQGDGAMVQRVMVVICEATGMAMGYYTNLSKENENLLLVKDFVS